MSKSRVMYCCTFSNYDLIFSPVVAPAGVDCVLISDRRPKLVRGWRWRPLPPAARGLSQFFANRYCKFFAHEIFPDADTSLYVDGNILVKADVGPLLEHFEASGADIGLCPHPTRTNAAAELESCVRGRKIDPEAAARARARLALHDARHPDRGLFAGAVIMRRHRSKQLARAMQIWWDETRDHTVRDQISLPYAIAEARLDAHVLPFFYRDPNPYFHQYRHRGSLLRDLAIFAQNKAFYGPAHRTLFAPVGRILEAALESGRR